jgi:hypothetical protein
MIQAGPAKPFVCRATRRSPPWPGGLLAIISTNRRSFKSLNYFLLLEEEVSPLFTVVSCPGFFVVVLPWLLP